MFRGWALTYYVYSVYLDAPQRLLLASGFVVTGVYQTASITHPIPLVGRLSAAM